MNSFSNFGKYFTYKDEVSRTISWGHWFTFLNIFLTILLGSAYILYSPNTDYTSLGNFYLIISWFGHFSCLAFLIYMLLLFPFSFIGSLRFYRIFAVTMAVILLAIMLVDIKIYQQIKIHLSLSVLELFFEQEGFSTGINFNFLYIAIPVLILIECYFSHLAWKHIYIHNYKKTTNAFVAMFLLCFLSTHVLNIWASAYKYTPITEQKTLFPAYYPMTANTFLAEHGWIIAEKSNHKAKFRPAHYPLENIEIETVDNYRNVLLILVNGLTYDTAFRLGKAAMPELNVYAENNMMFTNHYLGVNGFREASFELGYGLPAQYQSSIETNRYVPVIISEMRLQDYKIHAYLSNKDQIISKGQVSSVIGLRSNATSIYRTDNETVQAAVRAINKWDERHQFAVVSLNDLYDGGSCATYMAEVSHSTEIKAKYDKCLNNTDKHISMLRNAVQDAGMNDNTIIIITSAKARSENAYFRHNYHAPLIMHWPEVTSPSRIDMLTGTQDIAPTIAREVLGITNSPETFSNGINLRQMQSRPWILSGTDREFQIICETQTTIYDRQGNASIYADTPGANQQPNMTTLIKAMKLLNKFTEN